MPFKLEEVTYDDFPELISVWWESVENPRQGVMRAIAPILNNDREASLAKSTELQLQQYKKNYANIVWFKVVDDATNKIVGGAKWKIHLKNPYAEPPAQPFRAEWYPEGIGRDFATKVVLQLQSGRVGRAQRPHILLELAFTLPEYRCKGVGHLFMAWGDAKADELNLECWLSASDLGRFLYRKHGYIDIVEHDVVMDPPDHLSEAEREEWEAYQGLILPVHITHMWRPVGGKYIKGATVKPWEEKN